MKLVSPFSLLRQRRWIWVLLALAVLLALFFLRSSKKDVQAETQKKQDAAPVYELAEADIAVVEARELAVALPVSGALTPQNQATVRAKVAAEVKETPVLEGMPVKRGQIVVRLDPADLASNLRTKQAAFEDANAKLALAKKNHDNNLTLLNQKFISQNAFDTVRNSVELAEAAVKSAESQAEIARRALEDSTVRAPFDGVLNKRLVQPGEKVAIDAQLFSLVDLRELVFEAQVPAIDIPRVKVGQGVNFHVDGFGDRTFSGKVARISPAAEAGSRSMTVYVTVNNADGALRGGMFAQGGIVLEKSAVMPVMPLTALRDGAKAYKVQDGKLVAQPLQLGLRNEDEGMVEVKDGLRAGDRVIVTRLDTLKPGSGVKLPAPTQDAAKDAVAPARNEKS